jgi:hypothetical protein
MKSVITEIKNVVRYIVYKMFIENYADNDFSTWVRFRHYRNKY